MRPRSLAIHLSALIIASLLTAAPGASAVGCAVPDHAGGEWRQKGYDHGHSRHQPAESTIGPLEAATLAPAWTFDANKASGAQNNEITGYPIVADGCVYVGSSTGNQAPGFVFALNADTGDLVWKAELPHGVYSTLAVEDGKVYAFVSRVVSDRFQPTSGGPDCDPPEADDPDGIEVICGPYVVAFDQQTGKRLWWTTVDYQLGSDAVSSPVVWDGLVWVGVSGTAAEGEEAERFDFRGTSVLLDANTGELLKITYTIPDEDFDRGEGDAGGALWSTITIDEETKYGYAGTGNPFNYDHEHEHTNAVLKFDLDRTRPTFGEIVGSYKGDIEEYVPEVADNFKCEDFDPVEDLFVAGFECGRLDVDFGASAQLFRDSEGRKLVGAGQKSGVYHVIDPDTMEPVWKQIVGVPSAVGGIVGTPAYDGESLYGPHTVGGYVWSLDADDGAYRWVSPVADAVHWGNPVTSANGIIYTPDLKGFLDAYDAQTGAPLLHRPLGLGADTGTDPTFTWAGATVARNTVYVSVGVGLSSVGAEDPPWVKMPNGYVVAMRPGLGL